MGVSLKRMLRLMFKFFGSQHSQRLPKWRRKKEEEEEEEEEEEKKEKKKKKKKGYGVEKEWHGIPEMAVASKSKTNGVR